VSDDHEDGARTGKSQGSDENRDGDKNGANDENDDRDKKFFPAAHSVRLLQTCAWILCGVTGVFSSGMCSSREVLIVDSRLLSLSKCLWLTSMLSLL